MQKKIVAAICAAALALAMPVAAIAAETGNATVEGSMSTYQLEKAVDGDNADMTAFTMTVNSSYAKGAVVEKTSATASNYQAYTNDLMTQSFSIDAKNLKGENWNGTAKSVTYTIVFKQKKIDALPTTVDPNNLYTRAYVDHQPGTEFFTQDQPSKQITVNTKRCSVVTAVLANGPLSYGEPVGTNNTKDLDDAAKNGNVSPKTGEIAA